MNGMNPSNNNNNARFPRQYTPDNTNEPPATEAAPAFPAGLNQNITPTAAAASGNRNGARNLEEQCARAHFSEVSFLN
jgi:hypothetical protein